MRRYSSSLLSAAAVLLISVPGSAQTEDLAASVALMAKIGSCGSPTFSPDGKTIAFVSNMSGLPQIWTVPVSGGWPTQITALDDPVGGITFSPTADRIAFSLAPGGGMNSQVYVVDADGSSMRMLSDGGTVNNWLGDWTDDGLYLTIASSRRTPSAMDAWMLDADSGAFTLAAENPGVGSLSSVSADNARAVLGRTVSRGDSNLYLVNLESGGETLLTPHEGPGSFGGTITPDGKTVYVASNKNRDLIAFGRIEIGDDGTPGDIEILAARDDAELGGITLNHAATQAVLNWNVAGRNELEMYDLATGSHTPLPAMPHEIVGSISFSPDDSMLAMSVSGSTAPSDIWLLHLDSYILQRITYSPHAGIDLRTMIKPELVTFEAHDGLELSGWLYVPDDFKKPGPVVFAYHGGPEGQERPRFRSDYQALLSQGIAVFAPNVRGSSGFGKRFVNLDNGALRVDGVKDIMACVAYAVENGIADPDRLGIMGGSYGGYMVMAGLTEFPGVFAAGANLFGVVNFKTFFEQTEPWMAAISKVEYGDPDTEAEMLAMLSPINKVDRVTAPTIVLHGANDTNVPVAEAEQVVENLKARGVPVKYVLFADEGHGWRKTKNRITSTVAIVEWFEKYLK